MVLRAEYSVGSVMNPVYRVVMPLTILVMAVVGEWPCVAALGVIHATEYAVLWGERREENARRKRAAGFGPPTNEAE